MIGSVTLTRKDFEEGYPQMKRGLTLARMRYKNKAKSELIKEYRKSRFRRFLRNPLLKLKGKLKYNFYYNLAESLLEDLEDLNNSIWLEITINDEKARIWTKITRKMTPQWSE